MWGVVSRWYVYNLQARDCRFESPAGLNLLYVIVLLGKAFTHTCCALSDPGVSGYLHGRREKASASISTIETFSEYSSYTWS